MIKNLKILLIIIIPIYINTCIDPFYPNIEKYENALVVDGLISNEQKSYSVFLSRTLAFEEIGNKPEAGAIVTIIDDSGNSYSLNETEKEPGCYVTNPDELKGEIGRRYKLIIETIDGNKYESAYEELKRCPEIDSIYWKVEERPSNDLKNPVKGIQIYIDTHDPENNTRYYSWKWEETWVFFTPYRKDTLPNKCWKYDSSRVIQIGTTDHLYKDILKNYPLFYISDKTNKLFYKYSVLIKQYSLTKEAFNYWSQIEGINENTGTLFDPIPTKVPGNISCINNPNLPVIGYFQASSVSSRRIFISQSDLLGQLSMSTGFDYCETITITDQIDDEFPAYLNYVENEGWEIYFQEVSGNVLRTYLTNSISCCDCSITGSPDKPEFWED
ncbi:MAG: DUF4249 domain-containing protein [Bacteroidales bacterium]|nr:DUF4249 domain-containing protein [Bacteroidales bacterium]